jgi:hypothetical protein
MAHVTLFLPNQKPTNYPDVTDVNAEEGVLIFRAAKEPKSPATNKYVTNLPFLWVE